MKKILFVNQDIMPYVAETELSKMGRIVPQKIQEAKCEIRTFMPRWGNINERRGQLHEVIRLSGLNISINDIDHPLIIKVASIPATKVQVYFIDNEEFFTRKGQTTDDNGNLFSDNFERAAFFARGVIETIKKLRWTPDVIHCQGWMSSLVPLYVKRAYNEDPSMANVKVVTSFFEDHPVEMPGTDVKKSLVFNDITVESLSAYKDDFDGIELAKLAIDNSDGVIQASESINDNITAYANEKGKRCLGYTGDDFAKAYVDFYESLF